MSASSSCYPCAREVTLSGLREELAKARERNEPYWIAVFEKHIATIQATPPGEHTCGKKGKR